MSAKKRPAKKAAAAKKKAPARLTKETIVKAAKTPAPPKKKAGRPRKDMRPAKSGIVAEAVDHDLRELAKRDPGLARSALAASARTLAIELDRPGNSATSKSMCARALLDTLDRLRELAPEEEPQDGLDDLRARRAQRTAGRTGTTG